MKVKHQVMGNILGLFVVVALLWGNGLLLQAVSQASHCEIHDDRLK